MNKKFVQNILLPLPIPGIASALRWIFREQIQSFVVLQTHSKTKLTVLGMSGDRERRPNAGATKYMSKLLKVGESTQALRGIFVKE